MRTYTTTEGYTIKQKSRWLKVHETIVTPRHRLYEYSEEGVLYYFNHNGKMYALAEFIRYGCGWTPYVPTFEDEEGKIRHLSGINSDYHNPLMIELAECCDYVRVFKEVA